MNKPEQPFGWLDEWIRSRSDEWISELAEKIAADIRGREPLRPTGLRVHTCAPKPQPKSNPMLGGPLADAAAILCAGFFAALTGPMLPGETRPLQQIITERAESLGYRCNRSTGANGATLLLFEPLED